MVGVIFLSFSFIANKFCSFAMSLAICFLILDLYITSLFSTLTISLGLNRLMKEVYGFQAIHQQPATAAVRPAAQPTVVLDSGVGFHQGLTEASGWFCSLSWLDLSLFPTTSPCVSSWSLDPM